MGELLVTGLTDIATFDIAIETLFPDFDKKMLNDGETIDPRIVSDGLVHLTVRSWLLRQSGRVILIDSCVGAGKDRPSRPDWHRRKGTEWLQALSDQGLRPEDVDVVMCTHLHADHVGWNTRLENGHWVPTFPNAEYVCGRLEYDFWHSSYDKTDKHGAFADSVLPIVEHGKMQFVEDGWELATGLSVELSPGHTPGHLCLNAKGGALFCGDIIHSPLQLRFPELSSGFCVDPNLARDTREQLLLKTYETGNFLIPAHFPNPGWTKIEKTKFGYRQIN